MRLQKLELKNFRCFAKVTFDFSGDIVIIYGNNGSGKTTIIEALHYLCYLSSFRSRLPYEIAQFESDSFFIKGTIMQDDLQVLDLQVGFAQKQKVAKIGHNAISSYKELFPYYRIVTVTIDDLELIQGNPIVRRSFIDQAIMLANPEYLEVVKRFKQILQQRNALLSGAFSKDSYYIWTQQLWEQSKIIQTMRIEALNRIQVKVSQLLAEFFDPTLGINITYSFKRMLPEETFDQFIERQAHLLDYEILRKRSDLGAHLDDFIIEFCHKKARSFGSRGQQKLLVILIKIAQILDLQTMQSKPIFLLDDFVTDFDKDRLEKLLRLLTTLQCQLIITSPIREKLLEELLSATNISTIKLDSN